MTDHEHGMDIDPALHDTDTSHDGEGAQAWHDEHPPVDDFSDPELDHATHDAPSAEADAAAAKKKGTAVMLGVLLVGGLLVAGLVWMQFGGSGGSSVSSPQNNSKLNASTASSSSAASYAKTEQYPTTPTSSQVDMNELYQTTQNKTGTAPLAPAIPTPNNAMPDAVPQATVTMPSAPAVQQADSSPAPTPPVLPAVATPTTQQQITPPPSSSAPNLEAQLGVLSAQVATLQNQLGQATQKIDQMSLTPPSHVDTSALDARLNHLEQEMASTQLHGIAVSSAVTNPPPKTNNETSSPQPTIKSHHHEKAKSAAKHGHKTVHRVAASTKHHSKNGLMLRAATPDAAWVSSGSGSEDIRKVEVGDSLPNIGRVKAIRQNGDNWVVVGTKGTLQ